MKLHQVKFRLDTGQRFFNKMVLCQWNRFPREVVVAPSVSEFKDSV